MALILAKTTEIRIRPDPGPRGPYARRYRRRRDLQPEDRRVGETSGARRAGEHPAARRGKPHFPEVPERVSGSEPGPDGDPGRLHIRTARVLLCRHDHEPRGNRRGDLSALRGERRPLHVPHRRGIPFPGRGAETGRLRHQGGGRPAARETREDHRSSDRPSQPGLRSIRRSRSTSAGLSAPPVRTTRIFTGTNALRRRSSKSLSSSAPPRARRSRGGRPRGCAPCSSAKTTRSFPRTSRRWRRTSFRTAST